MPEGSGRRGGNPPHPLLPPGDAGSRTHHLPGRRIAVPSPPSRRPWLPHKDASAEEIETAIRALAAGHTHLDPAIQQRLIAAVIDAAPDNQPPPTTLPHARSRSIKLITAGISNAEIASRALVVSSATVKTHINHVLAKTGARGEHQAVRYAYQHGIA